jgi:adenine-specific DNA-methyltransferase
MQSAVLHEATLAESFIGEFVPRFAPGSKLVYTRGGKEPDDGAVFPNLGMAVDSTENMPDMVFHDAVHDWLLVVECANGYRLIDEMRLKALRQIFSRAKSGLVYVTVFPSRAAMADYPDLVAWGTHAWIADAPDHMIHFNGSRFLGPYASCEQ